MRRDELSDLTVFMEVAETRSFTRAAARLRTSQSALSHTMRRLEARLGLRLLTRTTRNVAPTEAGERLLATLRPALGDIHASLDALTELRDRPAGTIRINSGIHAATSLLWPALARFLPRYPDIHVDVVVDQSLADIVAGRFDAGVRLGEHVAKDMVAVPIGPSQRFAVVGAPTYFATRPRPRTPHDLAQHQCINMRMPSLGAFYAWEFDKDGRELAVRVEGQLAFNDTQLILRAAIEGFGLAIMMEDIAKPAIADGRLVRVLVDWCAPFAGYHLYYPSRRQLTPAFALLVESLRHRAPARRRS
ncbi:MAG: LysR family transcriptional regulator [Steroidobacteraceae bacterium]